MDYTNTSKMVKTASPDKYPQGYFKDKACRWCGTVFAPISPSHLLCSEECKDKASSEAYLKRNYKILRSDYLRLFEAQGGVCKICGSEGFKLNHHSRINLVVDHDHVSGKVRGLLCHNCNRALGLFQENLENLKSAITYLESATTISEESTLKRVEAVGTGDGDDIV